ncbi:hypothetical protein KY366_05925 [Candidatus Woesearchaeota archaeon]|nr:hypothetical protein [Candidatus Woesearchaeota archaeon]
MKGKGYLLITIAISFLITAIILLFLIEGNGLIGITGYVSSNVYKQDLNLVINQSQNFILTSVNDDPFTITSLKFSGNILGNGQVKIYIDTGRGQKVLIYENIAGKEEEEKGLLDVTGMATKAIENEETSREDKYLIIRPLKSFLDKEIFDEITNGLALVNGAFIQQCIETCFINMKMSKNTEYRLVFFVEKGTIVEIDEILYQINE